jgi:hypothetical protein
MPDYSGMTQEEIAGHFWDAQSAQIAEGSEYAGDTGRALFVENYASSFETWGDSGSKTILDLQTQMGDIQTAQVETELGQFVERETAGIQMEEKWWDDTGWTDADTGEYTESKKEMLTRQNDAMNEIMDRKRKDEIATVVKDFTETREAAVFKKELTGVNTHQSTDELRASLWSEVEGIKENYSDDKENKQKVLDRTVRDNKKNIVRGYEKVEEGKQKRELNIAHAGEAQVINDLGNKEEAMDSFGTELWATLRRLQSTGIFDEPIPDYVPPADTGKDYGRFTNFWTMKKWRLSDARVKENIEYLSTSPEGYKIYAFNYKGSDEIRCKGVIAQDVLDINKDAVKSIDGILHVDYSQIDVNMEILI